MHREKADRTRLEGHLQPGGSTPAESYLLAALITLRVIRIESDSQPGEVEMLKAKTAKVPVHQTIKEKLKPSVSEVKFIQGATDNLSSPSTISANRKSIQVPFRTFTILVSFGVFRWREHPL